MSEPMISHDAVGFHLLSEEVARSIKVVQSGHAEVDLPVSVHLLVTIAEEVGLDASHGHERTHLDAIRCTAELVAAYLQTPLTFAWDSTPTAPLEEFPDQDQPAER